MTSTEVGDAVDDNEQWFLDQYSLGAGTGITADEWFNLHHNQDEWVIQMYQRFRAFWAKPANDYMLMAVIFPIIAITFFPASKWACCVALVFSGLMGRIYGLAERLEGYLDGQKSVSDNQTTAKQGE